MKHFVLILGTFFLTSICTSQTVVQMQRTGGVSVIPCKVNGLDLSFIFDTGASDVSISLTEAIFMLKNGLLSKSDILGTARYSNANGQVSEAYVINIRQIEFAGLKLYNVRASITNNLDAPLLLGQSAIAKLGKFQLDLEKNTLTILNGRGNYDYRDYTQNYQPTEVINAQTSGKPTDAGVEVTVTDFKSNTQPNVMVVFKSSVTNKEYQGFTDQNGFLSLRLPVGSFYDVILMGNKDFTNSSFEIPRPTGNAYYKKPFIISIQFEPPTQIKENKTGSLIMRIFTEPNQSTFKARDFEIISGVVHVLSTSPDDKIQLIGYADKKEKNGYQMALQRVTNLKNYMVSQGVNSNQIEIKSMGSELNRPSDSYQLKNWRDSRVEIFQAY